MFSISNLDKVIVSSESWRSKLDLLCILNHLFVVLINLFYQLSFLFQLTEKGLFNASGVLFVFVECYFVSIVSMELV